MSMHDEVQRVLKGMKTAEAPDEKYGDFWKTLGSDNVTEDPDDMDGAFVGGSDGIDDFINGRELGGDYYNSLQSLTEKGRNASALPLPQVAGTRVRFIANLGSVLTYDDVPDPKVAGTVVTVKTANGPQTDRDGRVFVAWDDGVFRPIFAEHLRLAGPNNKRSSNVRMVVGSLGDISSMFVSAREGELVHRSTKDLWAVKKDGGNYVIERLFNDEGKPLKV